MRLPLECGHKTMAIERKYLTGIAASGNAYCPTCKNRVPILDKRGLSGKQPSRKNKSRRLKDPE